MTTSASSPRVPPSDAEIRQLLIERVDVQRKGVGLVVGVVSPAGRRVVAHGVRRKGGAAVDGDTAFEIASATKVFTALLLTDAIARGEARLDEPLANLLPSSVRVPERNGRKITLVDLATHTSGLPPHAPDLTGLDDPAAPSYSLDRLYAALSSYTLPRDVGAEWEYGNFDMALLGHALAHRAGTDYETLVRERITRPLGLSATSTLESTLGENVATSHDSDLEPTQRLALGSLAPAGSMLSSAHDLLTLLEVCIGCRPSALQPALDAMTRTRRPVQPSFFTMLRRYWRVMLKMTFVRRRGPSAKRPPRTFTRIEQGLGWFILGRDREEMVVHAGAGPSCAASIAFDRGARFGIVVLCNAGVNVEDVSRHLMRREAPLATARLEVRLDPAALDRYVGEYQSPESPPFGILRRDDRLFVKVPYIGALPLRAENEHSFFLHELLFEFAFDWDRDGRIHAMQFSPGRGQPMFPLPRRRG